MDEVYISIIVPVYNVESYLRECIDSILNQRFHDFELILVDDGSKDSCSDICDEYVGNNKNIKVFHKENGGLSDARNYGFNRAKGKYVLFVDSDDYIKTDSLDSIVRACKEQGEPDVMFLKARKLYGDGAIKKYDDDMNINMLSLEKTQVMQYLANRQMYPASAWSKMVRRNVLEENNIDFIVGQISEDYEWSAKLFIATQTFGAYDGEYYFYRQNRVGSITNSISEKSFSDVLDIIEHMKKLAADNEQYEKSLLSFTAYVYRTMLWGALPFYSKYKTQIKKNQYLLKMRNSKDVKIIRFVSSIIGIHLSIVLLEVYKKIRKVLFCK